MIVKSDTDADRVADMRKFGAEHAQQSMMSFVVAPTVHDKRPRRRLSVFLSCRCVLAIVRHGLAVASVCQVYMTTYLEHVYT